MLCATVRACVCVRVRAVRHDGCSPVLHTPCAAAASAVLGFVETRDCDCVSIRTFGQKLRTFFFHGATGR